MYVEGTRRDQWHGKSLAAVSGVADFIRPACNWMFIPCSSPQGPIQYRDGKFLNHWPPVFPSKKRAGWYRAQFRSPASTKAMRGSKLMRNTRQIVVVGAG